MNTNVQTTQTTQSRYLYTRNLPNLGLNCKKEINKAVKRHLSLIAVRSLRSLRSLHIVIYSKPVEVEL
jgi:hypothetical protein